MSTYLFPVAKMARTRMHHWSDPASFEEGKQAATFFIDPRWNKVQQIWNKSAEKSEISASCAHFHRKKSLQKVLSPKKKTRVVQVLYYKWQGKFKCSMQQWKRALCPGSTQHTQLSWHFVNNKTMFQTTLIFRSSTPLRPYVPIYSVLLAVCLLLFCRVFILSWILPWLTLHARVDFPLIMQFL